MLMYGRNHHNTVIFLQLIKKKYWSGLLFPSSGEPTNPGMELASFVFAGDSLPLSHQGSPGGHHAKLNKSEKDKYYIISLKCDI